MSQFFSRYYDLSFVSHSASMLLSMNFAGKSKTWQNVIKSVSSSSQVGSGRASAHFLDCSVYVTVSSAYLNLTVVTSMRTMPNKHFRPRIPQRFTLQSQLLRPFTGHGPVDPSARNLATQNPSVRNPSHSLPPSTLRVTKLMSTTRRPRTLLRTSCQ
jgi:hypothetical protein